MPPEFFEPGLLSHFASLFGGRGGSTVGSRQDSDEIPSAGAGPSRPDHLLTRSVPADSLLTTGSSTLQFHGSQPPIRQSSSGNNIVESSQCAALSMPSNHDLLRQPPHQPLPALQSDDNPGVPRVYGDTTTFLAGASGFRMRDIHYYEASRLPVDTGGGAGDSLIDGWELLLKNIAPNALHDSSARYDAPKCDEDTRIEVTGEIMDWIHDRDGPQRLLCMTGAAGSGKSALQQTTAEKCSKNGTLGSAFFFSASDSTRNTVKQVIPTIAYQLGRTNGVLRQCIKAAVESDRLIFTKSLRTQICTLIVEPLQLCQGMGMNLTRLPHAILIDGLDECTGEARQAELLTAVEECLLINGLPYRVFIASRPEMAIHTALQPGGHLCKVAYHIQLSDQYDASGDMRRYLRRRFEVIGLRIGNSNWFSEDDIETLVRAGSGQFVYVATVYKYVSEPRGSPTERLRIVLTWTPRAGQVVKPFEALDRLYYNVLMAARNAYEAVDTHYGRDFCLLFRVHQMGVTGFFLYLDAWRCPPADFLSALLLPEIRAEQTLISDLRSLVALRRDEDGNLRLHLYHKSFSDFLEESSRSKGLFVPEPRVWAHLAECFMQRIIECPLDFDTIPAKWEKLPLRAVDRRFLKEAVEVLPFSLRGAPALDGDEIVDFTQNGGWQKIDNLLPLLFCEGSWLFRELGRWLQALEEFTWRLKAQNPEAAAFISVFSEKWGNNFEQSRAKDGYFDLGLGYLDPEWL